MDNCKWQASRPDYSIWVSASAGTGKTKILTDRVLRLLLESTAPAKILCLTFTNAAAGEMQSRIANRLATWATISMTELQVDLQNMLGQQPTAKILKCAQTLFNKHLSSDEKIEIHTIHSYCQKILQRFPIEAKVSPGFQILDDIQASEIVVKIKQQLYLDANFSEVVEFFTANFHEMTINELLSDIISQRLQFKRLLNIEAPLYDAQLSQLAESEKIFSDIQGIFSHYQEIIGKPLSSKAAILSFFLTKDGLKRQKIIPQEVALNNPKLLAACQEYQEIIYKLGQLANTKELINYSKLLTKFATTFIDKYDAYKARYGLLDYDDLIFFTKDLLTNSKVKDWVLYKLDGGIDHLLIDEAQDTSLEQWQIIEAMIAEFYAGEVGVGVARTIFVVEDEKQSIFSFQGANLTALKFMSHNLKNKLTAASKNYAVISLQYSYRSTAAVLDVVYNIFARIKQLTPDLFLAANPKILPFREESQGRVELWPLIKSDKPGRLFWPTPQDHQGTLSSKKQLAIKIARYIQEEIASRKILPATGLPIRAEDFMILVRTRDSFSTEIVKSLKAYALDTTGIDRMLLSEHLSVMDLIAVAKFTLNQFDDLNLATVLNSPLIALGELTIQQLRQFDNNAHLFTNLQKLSDVKYSSLAHAPIDLAACRLALKKLKLFLKLYDKFDAANFFCALADGLSYRELLIKANGCDSSEAISELLYLSFNYTNNVERSLQSFIYWFEANEIEIKRNVASTNKIKLMTVHGAKGLQAPVVILCDTTSVPSSRRRFLWTKDQVIATQQGKSPEFFKSIKQQQQLQELQEYVRLLYVGLTRAQDNLVICGYLTKEEISPYCWYQLVADAMQALGTMNQDKVVVYENVVRVKKQVTTPVDIVSDLQSKRHVHQSPLLIDFTDQQTDGALLEWQTCKVDLADTLFASTSKSNGAVPATTIRSPLNNSEFLEYGKIFHKILENAIKTKDWQSMRAGPLIKTLSADYQQKIQVSIDNLLAQAEFISLTQGEVKTEVNIGFADQGETRIGRIDLLVITSSQLTIIDYKSDAQPATNLQSVPASYIEQLAFYKRAVQKLYPAHKILCKILWLQNGEFTSL